MVIDQRIYRGLGTPNADHTNADHTIAEKKVSVVERENAYLIADTLKNTITISRLSSIFFSKTNKPNYNHSEYIKTLEYFFDSLRDVINLTDYERAKFLIHFQINNKIRVIDKHKLFKLLEDKRDILRRDILEYLRGIDSLKNSVDFIRSEASDYEIRTQEVRKQLNSITQGIRPAVIRPADKIRLLASKAKDTIKRNKLRKNDTSSERTRPERTILKLSSRLKKFDLDIDSTNGLTPIQKRRLFFRLGREITNLIDRLKEKLIISEESTDVHIEILEKISKYENFREMLLNDSDVFTEGLIPDGANETVRLYEALCERQLQLHQELQDSNTSNSIKENLRRELSFITQRFLSFSFNFTDGIYVNLADSEYYKKFILERFLSSIKIFTTQEKIEFMNGILESANDFIYVQGDTGTGKTTIVSAIGNMLFGKEIGISQLRDLRPEQDSTDDSKKWFFGSVGNVKRYFTAPANFNKTQEETLAQMLIKNNIKYVVIDELSLLDEEDQPKLKQFITEIEKYNNENPKSKIKVVFTGNPEIITNGNQLLDIISNRLQKINFPAPKADEFYSTFLKETAMGVYGVHLPNEFIKVASKDTVPQKTSSGNVKLSILTPDFNDANHGHLTKFCLFLDNYNKQRIRYFDNSKHVIEFNNNKIKPTIPLTFAFFNKVLYTFKTKLNECNQNINDNSDYNKILEYSLVLELVSLSYNQDNKSEKDCFNYLIDTFKTMELISDASVIFLKDNVKNNKYLNEILRPILTRSQNTTQDKFVRETDFIEIGKFLNLLNGGVEISTGNPPSFKNVRVSINGKLQSVRYTSQNLNNEIIPELEALSINVNDYIYLEGTLVKYLGFIFDKDGKLQLVVENRMSGKNSVIFELIEFKDRSSIRNINKAIEDGQSNKELAFMFYDQIIETLSVQNRMYESFGVKPIYPTKEDIDKLYIQIHNTEESERKNHAIFVSLGYELNEDTISLLKEKINTKFKQLGYKFEISDEAINSLNGKKIFPKLNYRKTSNGTDIFGFASISFEEGTHPIDSFIKDSANLFTSLTNLYYLIADKLGNADKSEVYKLTDLNNYDKELDIAIFSIITQGFPRTRNCYLNENLILQHVPNENGTGGMIKLITKYEKDTNDAIDTNPDIAKDCITDYRFIT